MPVCALIQPLSDISIYLVCTLCKTHFKQENESLRVDIFHRVLPCGDSDKCQQQNKYPDSTESFYGENIWLK